MQRTDRGRSAATYGSAWNCSARVASASTTLSRVRSTWRTIAWATSLRPSNASARTLIVRPLVLGLKWASTYIGSSDESTRKPRCAPALSTTVRMSVWSRSPWTISLEMACDAAMTAFKSSSAPPAVLSPSPATPCGKSSA